MRVYLIRNRVNGKRYVGKTIRDVNERWKEHKQSASAGKGYVLGAAIRKHGVDSFDLSVLEECENEAELIIAEVKWIAELDTFHGLGYNMTEGGEGNSQGGKYERTPEIRRKMSESRKRVAANPTHAMLEEHRKHSERMKGENNPCFGKSWGRKGPLREETKKKISEAHMGKILSESHKSKIKESLKLLRKAREYVGPNKGKCYPIIACDTDGNRLHTFVNFDAAAIFVGMHVKKLRSLVKNGEKVKGLLFSKSKIRMDRETIEQMKKETG